MTFWQDINGAKVSGVERCKLWTVTFHHLQQKYVKTVPAVPLYPNGRDFVFSLLPGLDLIRTLQETFLTHPLIAQELRPGD